VDAVVVLVLVTGASRRGALHLMVGVAQLPPTAVVSTLDRAPARHMAFSG
jgi:hypothetical protein